MNRKGVVLLRALFLLAGLLLLPEFAFAEEFHNLGLTGTERGIYTVLIFLIAYGFVMAEQLPRPIVPAFCAIWSDRLPAIDLWRKTGRQSGDCHSECRIATKSWPVRLWNVRWLCVNTAHHLWFVNRKNAVGAGILSQQSPCRRDEPR